MRQVWKEELMPGHWQIIESKPLFFAAQGDGLFVWFDHRDQPGNEVMVGVYGTGHEVHPNAVHALSCQQGPFVWHLFTLDKELM